MTKVNDKSYRKLCEFGLEGEKIILPPPPKPLKQLSLDDHDEQPTTL